MAVPLRRPRRHAAAGALGLALALALGGVAACSDDESGSPEELCAVLGDGRAYTALFEQGFDPTDTAHAVAQLDAARVDLEQLRAAAPAEVRGAIDAELAYLAAVHDVLRTVDPADPAAVVAGINDLGDERAAAEVASLQLRAYEQAHCR